MRVRVVHAAVQRAPTVAGFVVLTPSRPLARRGATRGLDDIAPLPPAAAALRAGVWQGTAMSQPAWIAQRAAEERAALAAKTAELKAAAVTSPVILSAKKDAGPSKAAMAAAASRDRRANRRQSQIDISAAQAVRYPPPRPPPPPPPAIRGAHTHWIAAWVGDPTPPTTKPARLRPDENCQTCDFPPPAASGRPRGGGALISRSTGPRDAARRRQVEVSPAPRPGSAMHRCPLSQLFMKARSNWQ